MIATAATARLFVALWPDVRVRAALDAAAAQWRFDARAARVRPERMHLTLHFLGAVDRLRLPEIRSALALTCAPQFTLTLSRPALWHGGIAVLEPARVPPALTELHAAIATTLRRLELPVETRPFRPHVTLARHTFGASPPERRAAVRWATDGHALVESRPAGDYVVVARCPASARIA